MRGKIEKDPTTVFIINENVDLGSHVHSVWESEADAKDAVHKLNVAYAISFPMQQEDSHFWYSMQFVRPSSDPT